MTTEDRLRSAFHSLGALPPATEAAWGAVKMRADRRKRHHLLRRIAALLVPLLGLGGLGLGLSEALAPASRPTEVTVVPGPSPAAQAFGAVDWASVVATPGALACNQGGAHFTGAVDQVGYVKPDHGPVLALVLAHCDAAGDPPSGLFVYDRPSGRAASLVQVLLSPSLDDVAYYAPFSLSARSVRLQVGTYNVHMNARCCPDQRVVLGWEWDGSRYGRARTVRLLPNPIGLTATITPRRAEVGQTVSVRLSITNRSHVVLNDFSVVSTLPSQPRWLGAVAGCLAPREADPACGLASLSPGQTRVLQVTAQVRSVPVPRLYFSVSANTPPGGRDPYPGKIDSAAVTVTAVTGAP